MEKIWYLYILSCGDGTLYTGITDDVARRLQAHRDGKGAKYTRGRGPLILVYSERCASHSDALRRESAVKKLPRKQKLDLILRNCDQKICFDCSFDFPVENGSNP